MIPREPLAADPAACVSRNFMLMLGQFTRLDQLLRQRIEQLQQETLALAEHWHAAHEDLASPDWLTARQAWQAPDELSADLHDSRLQQLVQQFSLSTLERDLLLLVLMPLLDTRYHSIFSQAQGQSRLQYPTRQFAMDILCPEPCMQAQQMSCLLPAAPLIRYGLLKLDGPPDNYSGLMLKPDASIYHFLIGHVSPPTILAPYCHWQKPSGLIAASLNDCVKQLACALSTSHSACIILKGLPGSGRSSLVAQAAQWQHRRTLVLDLADLPEEQNDGLVILLSAIREVKLWDGCLVLKNISHWNKKYPRILARWKHELQDLGQPLISLQELSAPLCWLGDVPHLVLEMPRRSLHQDRALLERHLQISTITLDNDIKLDTLVQRFPIVASRLTPILQEAELYRQQRNPASALCHDDLHRAFRWRSQQNFGDLAHRIEPQRRFADWIAPPDLQQHMQELTAAIKQREHALNMGFGNHEQGISALFHGTSGAGKTMAAEILAESLGIDLIKVDLSTVVNKYIGETEKNLATIFDLAAMDSGLLFFDEADALFGKRSENKDAKDRHANIEVAYLLQRMEAHAGLVILSTNNRSHLDNAFSRRFTFMLKFGFPDQATRFRLWRSIWPDLSILAHDVDFERLSCQAEITGANIRNIALAACWLAAEAGAPCIGMAHIQQALKRELAKTGQVAFL